MKLPWDEGRVPDGYRQTHQQRPPARDSLTPTHTRTCRQNQKQPCIMDSGRSTRACLHHAKRACMYACITASLHACPRLKTEPRLSLDITLVGHRRPPTAEPLPSLPSDGSSHPPCCCCCYAPSSPCLLVAGCSSAMRPRRPVSWFIQI